MLCAEEKTISEPLQLIFRFLVDLTTSWDGDAGVGEGAGGGAGGV